MSKKSKFYLNAINLAIAFCPRVSFSEKSLIVSKCDTNQNFIWTQ